MKLILAAIAGILISILIAWILAVLSFRCTTKKWPRSRKHRQEKDRIKRLAHLRGWDLEKMVVTKRKSGTGPELM